MYLGSDFAIAPYSIDRAEDSTTLGKIKNLYIEVLTKPISRPLF